MDLEFHTASSVPDVQLPDIYYSPRYAASAEILDEGTWECAVAASGRIYFAYLRRTAPGDTGAYDLVTPYGYAGVHAPDAASRAEFVTSFRHASRDRGLVAEFLRGNPFDVRHPDEDGLMVDTWRAHPTFAVDLSVGGLDGYWDGSEGRHRTSVRKAMREGVTVSECDPDELLHDGTPFRRLYDQTMERVGSGSRLRLGNDYYSALLNGVGESAVRVLEARHHEEVVAASIFLKWGDRTHYHLSGSTEVGMRLGASNALLDQAVRRLVTENGVLHLGGGVTAGDGLERFKRSVGNRATTVHLCRTVVDRERYDCLVAEAGVDPDTDYFPAYRA